MAPSLDVDRFLEDLSGRYAEPYRRAVLDLFVAKAKENKPQLRDARERLGDVIDATMGMGEVLGASSTLKVAARDMADRASVGLMHADALAPICGKKPGVGPVYDLHREMVTFADQAVLPSVTFTEALENMVKRTPTTLKDAATRTAQNIARLYGEGSGGLARVAFVRSAEQAVTERVQSMLAQAIREGREEIGVGRMISTTVEKIRKDSRPWSEAYSRMVFRTNLNTAVTAGRFRQAQDPAIQQVTPAFRFDTAGDSDVRDNHKAGDGAIMLSTNPAWNDVSAPLGYNCRCQVSLVGVPMLRRMNRVRTEPTTGFTRVTDTLFVREDRPPSGWRPDDGFRHGGRPDLLLSG